jgi:hypothetical protein
MMWGFGWIFPLIGLGIAAVCVIAMLRWLAQGGGPMCMGGHQGHGAEEAEQLRRQVRELREEVDRLKAVR